MHRAVQIAGGLLLGWLASQAAARLPDLVPLPGVTPERPAAASPPPEGDPAPLPAGPERVASYTLRASLDPVTHVVRGEGTLSWRNASSAPQEDIYVHLYLNAWKSPRSLFLRTPMAGFRGDPAPHDLGRIDVARFAVREMDGADVWPRDRPTTPGDPEDETDIRVPLPRPVAPGEAITVDLAWEARLPSISLRTGHHRSFHMVAQWFPKIARLEPDGRWAHFPFHRLSEFYADFGVYDVTVEVPEGFAVGATGRLERETRSSGRVERRFVQEDVHDFAFAAWDRFREITATSEGGVAIRCLFPPGSERAAEIEVEAARLGLAHLGARLGAYPYGTLTLVHPPEGAAEAGGMEYPTLITTGGAWHHAYTAPWSLESLTLHELAHQWFYGLLATNEQRYPFLDEGLTTWAEIDALRARHGAGSGFRALGLEIDARAIHRIGSLWAGRDGIVGKAAPEFASGAEYGGLVYSRVATLLATLGGVYGEDRIHEAIGRYARAHRFRHPGPEDLVQAVREAAGEAAAEALHVGIFEGGWVDYAVTEVMPDVAPAALEGGPAYGGYALVRRRGTLALPVDVELRGADGSVQRTRWEAAEAAIRVPYAGASPLVAAAVDPDHRALIDEDLSNNARDLDPPVVAPRVLDAASFAAGAALWVMGP